MREFSVVVGISAARAQVGARVFQAAAQKVNRANLGMAATARTAQKSSLALITTIGRIRGVATLAFAGFLGVGGIGAVVSTLATFEKSMSNVKALLGDRGVGGAMSALTNKARELGATTAFTASQAAEGMKFLTLAGFDALETFQAIGPALELAQAGALGLGEAADIVSNIMQGFNINASRTGEVVDALAFVASRSNTSIQQLGQAMKFVAPVAGALNLSVQEVSAALGLLGNSGLQASLAGTGLRRVLSGLLNPSKEATKVLEGMGLTSGALVEALQDPKKGLTFVIKELERAGLGAAEAFTLFGQRGAPAVLSLLGQTGKLAEFNKQMENIAGTARTIGQVMIDNLAGDARIAISAVQEAILRLGEAGLTEWLRDTTQAFTAFIRGLAGIDQELEKSTTKVRKWAAAGMWMRENVDLLRQALVTFVLFLNRGLLVSIAASIGRFILLGATVAGLAGPFAIASAGALLLAGTMAALRTAIIATGVGALVVAVGFLLDWLLFSKEAETQNDRTTASYNRQKSVIENLAFEFEGMNKERQRFAVQELAIFIQGEEIALIRMTRQLENANDANARLTQANLDVAAAQERVNAVLKFNTTAHSENFKAGSESQLALIEREDALLRQAEAELLLSTAAGVTASKLADQKQVVADLTLRLAAQVSVYAGLDKTIADYIARINGATDANADWIKKLDIQTGLSDTQLLSLKSLVEEYSKNEKKIEELTDALDLFNTVGKHATVIEKAMGVEAGTLARVQKEVAFELFNTSRALSTFEKAAKSAKEKIEDLRVEGNKLAEAQLDTRRKVAELRDEFLAGLIGPELFREAMILLRGDLIETMDEIESSCPKVEKVKECMDENSKAMASIWDQAMRNIQDSFADAFRNIGDGFSSFADSLLDAFKDLLANMAAQAAISNIFGQGGGFFKDFIGGLTGGGDGNGGFGQLLSGLLGGGGTAGATGITGATSGAGAGAGGLGALAINPWTVILAAIIGNSKLFDEGWRAATAGIDPARLFADGLIAGFTNPLGSILTMSMAGTQLLDDLLQGIGLSGSAASLISGSSITARIFGRKAPETTQEGLNIGFSNGAVLAEQFADWFAKGGLFRSNKRGTVTGAVDSEEIATLQSTFDALLAPFATAVENLGGNVDDLASFTQSSTRLELFGKTEEEIAALIAEFLTNSVQNAVVNFLRTSESISAELRTTILQFEGDAEKLLQAFTLVGNIEALRNLDVLTEATIALQKAQMSSTEILAHNVSVLREVIGAYDVSLSSLAALENAYSVVTSAQIQMIASLQAVGDQISSLFQGSAQTVREALLSEEELYNVRRSQIDDLVAQATQTTDPEELNRLAQEINRLGLDAFNLLDESQQQTLGAEFIDFFTGLDDLFGDQIATGIASVVNDQAALDQEVADRMTEAAQSIIDANNAAQDLWERWREDLDDRRRSRLGRNELSR